MTAPYDDEFAADDIIVVTVDGREYPLDLYSAAYIAWLREDELGRDATDLEVATHLEVEERTPASCPVQVIDLNCQGGVWMVPGDAPTNRGPGLQAMELVGFSVHLALDVMADGTVEWWTSGSIGLPVQDNGPPRVEWCLLNCRGSWLIQAGGYNDRTEEYPLFVMLLNQDDQDRFNAAFPWDVRTNRGDA